MLARFHGRLSPRARERLFDVGSSGRHGTHPPEMLSRHRAANQSTREMRLEHPPLPLDTVHDFDIVVLGDSLFQCACLHTAASFVVDAGSRTPRAVRCRRGDDAVLAASSPQTLLQECGP